MKINILITDIIIKEFTYEFKKKFNVDCLWIKKNKINFDKYEAIVVTGGHRTNKQFLKKFTNLKIVSVFGVGYDGVDLDYCKKNRIEVTNTPKVLTNDVADLGLGLMINLSRKINLGHNYILQKKWSKNSFNLTNSLTNKIVGVVGMGEIGKAFARRAKSLSMEIVYNGPSKKKIKYKFYEKLEDMVSFIDVMFISCLGGSKTKHIINSNIIKLMKPTSIIINISRGSVINENHLLDSLKKKIIAGAALDVFENEPKINSKFLNLKNVLLSPHNGSGTLETRKKMAIVSCKNIDLYLKTKKCKNSILLN